MLNNINSQIIDFTLIGISNYDILSSTYLGKLYDISLNESDISFNIIQNFNYKNNYLQPYNLINNSLKLISNIEIEKNNILELSYNIGLKNQSGTILTFYQNNFNYIYNQTFIKLDSQYISLYLDSSGYFIDNEIILPQNVLIINLVNISSVRDTQLLLYNINLSSPFNYYSNYLNNYSNILPTNFKLNNTIIPNRIEILNDNNFYIELQNQNLEYPKFITFQHYINIGETPPIQVTSITLLNKFLYYINQSINIINTLNYSIYIYDYDSIDPSNNICKLELFDQTKPFTFSLNFNYDNNDLKNKRIKISYKWEILNTKYIYDPIKQKIIINEYPEKLDFKITDEYKYYINDQEIDTTKVQIGKSNIIISLSEDFTIDNNFDIIFEQIYYTKCIINRSNINQFAKIKLINSYQYLSVKNLYINGYDSLGNNIGNYLYRLEFDTAFNIYSENNIILSGYNIETVIKIFYVIPYTIYINNIYIYISNINTYINNISTNINNINININDIMMNMISIGSCIVNINTDIVNINTDIVNISTYIINIITNISNINTNISNIIINISDVSNNINYINNDINNIPIDINTLIDINNILIDINNISTYIDNIDYFNNILTNITEYITNINKYIDIITTYNNDINNNITTDIIIDITTNIIIDINDDNNRINSYISDIIMYNVDISNNFIYNITTNINNITTNINNININNGFSLIISTNVLLDVNKNYKLQIDDNRYIPKMNSITGYNIKFYQKLYNNLIFYDQDDINTITVLIDSSCNSFYFINTYSDKLKSYYYLSAKSDNIKLNNILEPSILKQTEPMKIKVNQDNINNIISEKPIFNHVSTWFNNINFVLGEQIIETLNNDTMNTNYNVYYTEERKKQYDKITKIVELKNYWQVILPLEFWFNNKSTLAIPLISLPYIDLYINYQVNKIENILQNKLINYSFDVIPEIKVEICIDSILLDTTERILFGSSQHEYIIERYKIYSPYLIYQTNQTVLLKLTNLVKN